MEKTISVKNLDKVYKLFHNSKERLYSLFSPQSYGEDFFALKNIDFSAYEGEVIGFVGINGSGKSTLSNIIAGIVPETRGSVKVNGQAALIAVSAGLKNDLTGRDNIELKLLMLGFSKEEIKKLEPEIIEFAELEKFIDQPVKSYSSGMKSRLGFAISVNIEPDILIIDEALSVGDKAFAQKSLNKMYEFKEQGKTMIFVSHSIGQMKKFCDKILWLEFGEVKEYGAMEEVIPQYESFLSVWQNMNKKERHDYKNKTNIERDVYLNKINIYKQSEQISVNELYSAKELPVSFIGRIIEKNGFIYDNENVSTIGPKQLNKTYFINRSKNVRNEVFYLLREYISTGQFKKIGWVNSEIVKKYLLVYVDDDHKRGTLSGGGEGYKIPWGNIDELKISNLKDYKSQEVEINKTILIGKNIWYKVETLNTHLDFWIHESYLENVYENKKE